VACSGTAKEYLLLNIGKWLSNLSCCRSNAASVTEPTPAGVWHEVVRVRMTEHPQRIEPTFSDSDLRASHRYTQLNLEPLNHASNNTHRLPLPMSNRNMITETFVHQNYDDANSALSSIPSELSMSASLNALSSIDSFSLNDSEATTDTLFTLSIPSTPSSTTSDTSVIWAQTNQTSPSEHLSQRSDSNLYSSFSSSSSFSLASESSSLWIDSSDTENEKLNIRISWGEVRPSSILPENRTCLITHDDLNELMQKKEAVVFRGKQLYELSALLRWINKKGKLPIKAEKAPKKITREWLLGQLTRPVTLE